MPYQLLIRDNSQPHLPFRHAHSHISFRINPAESPTPLVWTPVKRLEQEWFRNQQVASSIQAGGSKTNQLLTTQSGASSSILVSHFVSQTVSDSNYPAVAHFWQGGRVGDWNIWRDYAPGDHDETWLASGCYVFFGSSICRVEALHLLG